MPKPRPPKKLPPTYQIHHPTSGNHTEIAAAATALAVSPKLKSKFINDVVEALSYKQVFDVEMDDTATPSEIQASLKRIKLETQRLRERTGFLEISRTLDSFLASCNFWTQEYKKRIKPGRRKSKSLEQTMVFLVLVLVKYAPNASPDDIKAAARTCLGAAGITYPDPADHSDRFNLLFPF